MPATVSQPHRPGGRFTARSDPDLIQACLDGEKESWEELVSRYGRLVYSVARRYGLAEADAQDVFQNVFVIVYRQLDGVRDRERLPAWIIRTTQRECYRLGARLSARPIVEQDLANLEAPAEDLVVMWEHRVLVRVALRRLAGRCEQLLTALFLAPGRPNYEAVAQEMGMKIGSIGPTRARCFRKLEKILIEMGLAQGESEKDVSHPLPPPSAGAKSKMAC